MGLEIGLSGLLLMLFMFRVLTRMVGMAGKTRHRAAVMVALLLLGIAAASVPAFADPHDRLERIQDKKEEAREQRERAAARGAALTRKIARLDAIRSRYEGKVDRLDERIETLDSRIETTSEELEREQVRLALETEELQSILGRLDRRSDLFTERARASYMAGPTAYLDSLLSSESVNDLINQTSYHEAILESDSALIDQIEVLRSDSEQRRDEILEKEHKIALAKRRLETDRAAIARVRVKEAEALALKEEALAGKRELLRDARRDESRFRALEDQLDQDSQELTNLIQQQAAAAASPTQVPVPSIAGPTGGRLLWPAPGALISPYGYRTHPIFGDTRLHTGIDIGAPYGATVSAADNGTVTYVGVMSGYGNVIVVDHGGGLSTTYNHLSAFSVATGQSVGRGQALGAVGCTGYCTGPHLHFEVRVNGAPVDPMPYLQ